MNIIFVSSILDDKGNRITQIISSVPSVTVKAISKSQVLDATNTTNFKLTVIESTIDKPIVAGEIASYLRSNPETSNFKQGTYKNGTIGFEW